MLKRWEFSGLYDFRLPFAPINPRCSLPRRAAAGNQASNPILRHALREKKGYER